MRTILHIFFIGIITALTGCHADQTTSAKDQAWRGNVRPNLLWITCEDMGPILPAYGDSTIMTPNLNRLASEGIVFDEAFSVSGVCSPSRSALITGMYPVSIGTHHHRAQVQMHPDIPGYEVVPPPEVKCFTEYLRKAGYYCTNNAKADYNFGGGINTPPASAFDESHWTADWTGRKPGQPFFSIFNFGITHMFKLWKREDQPLRVEPNQVPVPPYFPDTYKARTSIARLYDNVMLLDDQIGDLLSRLEADGVMDSTIIFFFSDHGDGLPRNKIWLYDSGIKVPLIVRFPQAWGAGSRSRELVSFVDFAPTVLRLAGVDIPSHLQGQPFSSFFPDQEPRNRIFAAKDRIDFELDRIRAVRTSRFKYIRNYFPERPYIQNFPWTDSIALMQEWRRLHELGELNDIQAAFFAFSRPKEELYDMLVDPYETRNLAFLPEYQETLEFLRSENERHIDATGDLGFIDEKELVDRWWPSGIQPVTAIPVFSIDDKQVEIECGTPGASIIFRILNRQVHEKLYHHPLHLQPGDTLIARAIRYGFENSAPDTLVVAK